MNAIHPQSSACHCCASRRRFLAAGCGACAASMLPLSFGRASDAEAKSDRPRVRLVFACFGLTQPGPTWPHIGHDFRPRISQVKAALRKHCQDVEIIPTVVHKPEDAQKLLETDEKDGIDGYVVYQMNNWIKVMQPIVASGKPTLIADFLYAGSGGFLCYTASLRRQHDNFSVVASSNLEDLIESVKCFRTLADGGATAEFVAACDRTRRERTPAERPMNYKHDPIEFAGIGECLSNMKKSRLLVIGPPMQDNAAEKIEELLGIDVILKDYDEIAALHEAADRDEAREIADRWKANAKSVFLNDEDDTLMKSARHYLAQKAMMKKYGAEGITINCLGGFYSGKLKGYPCLGFVELLNDGLIGACEADLFSSSAMIAMKHLAGRPGYISDPVLDTSKRQIIYAHCVATTKPLGPRSEENAYEILTHSEDRRGASVRSFLPEGYMLTTMQIHPLRREILCHQGQAVGNVVNDRACRTKLACEVSGDFEKLFTFWDQYGWHRVTFYGDLLEPVKELAAALKFNFVKEA
ncbi:MAG: hypothetical protein JW959_09720 [Pirellulales bacterium]|nr:hypothetical protein [Pirellulales bacterium]